MAHQPFVHAATLEGCRNQNKSRGRLGGNAAQQRDAATRIGGSLPNLKFVRMNSVHVGLLDAFTTCLRIEPEARRMRIFTAHLCILAATICLHPSAPRHAVFCPLLRLGLKIL